MPDNSLVSTNLLITVRNLVAMVSHYSATFDSPVVNLFSDSHVLLTTGHDTIEMSKSYVSTIDHTSYAGHDEVKGANRKLSILWT